MVQNVIARLISIAFEALRPSDAAIEGKEVSEPSYMPLAGPMAVYIACQGLV